MSQLYTNLLSALVIVIGAATIFELWKQRHNLSCDELDDDTRALCWRVVIFLIFPFIVWMDLRATVLATEYLGGWVKEWHYGLLWFSAVPQSLPSADLLIPALFAGVLVQLLLLLCLMPSLFFRPHPFLATIITYTVTLILASNIIVEPLIALVGVGGSRWQIAYASAPRDALMLVMAIYAFFAVLFMAAVKSKTVRIWFAELTNPLLAEQLRLAISEASGDRNNQYQICRLGILYEKAAMRSSASRELAQLRRIGTGSIYLPFLEGFILYRRRNYRKARASFEKACDCSGLNDLLLATFYSAAACAAYAEGDMHGSLNLSERALELDESTLVARMVKVDAYLRLGKKEQAGEEVLAALRLGSDFELEEKVPLDAELTLRQIFRLQRAVQHDGAREQELLAGATK
jgi:hypothetical protein